jgi:hypothetical protein
MVRVSRQPGCGLHKCIVDELVREHSCAVPCLPLAILLRRTPLNMIPISESE